MDYITKSESQTQKLANIFLSKYPQSRLLGLSGDLGSGKTAFTKGLAKALGVEKNLTSPTFVIEKIYNTRQGKLVHIDAYRLSSLSDLEAIGFDEIVADDEAMVVIEWPEKVFSQFPDKMKIINFKYIDDEKRQITF